jgi:ATP-dependent RNA helicase DeaD
VTNEFTSLNLHPQLVQTLVELGYTEPTPIQSGVIPVMLTGQDVIGQAQTGTGKTAAFSLPILHNLHPNQKHVQSLILTPTRELAMQVAGALYEYGSSVGVRVLAVYGGQPYSRQINRLKKGVDVVVGTPGRLLDLINKKALDLSEVQTVVLDEADEMLSMGFIEDIESILNETSPRRQTALFSATLPPAIRRLADRYMQAPESITIKNKQMTVAAIEQRYYLVNHKDKLAALTRLFEVEPITSALIFVRTRLGTGELANELTVRGFNAEALNGDLSQEARERVLGRFRNNQIKVLVATDVAARGLDIDDISHVFNYDLPEEIESYVHRIGRTGRAGKTGIAISLLTPKEQWRLHRIEGYVKQKITPSTLPTVEDIHKLREAQLLEQVNVWLQRDRCRRERELVNELVEAGHDLIEVAAVALKLARAEEKQRPIMKIGKLQESTSRRGRNERKRESRKNGDGRKRANDSHEKDMVSLTLDKGRAHGVRPNDVVSTIAYHSNVPGQVIGRIHIENQHTLVDVPEKFVAQVLANSQRYRVRRQPIVLERA